MKDMPSWSLAGQMLGRAGSVPDVRPFLWRAAVAVASPEREPSSTGCCQFCLASSAARARSVGDATYCVRPCHDKRVEPLGPESVVKR